MPSPPKKLMPEHLAAFPGEGKDPVVMGINVKQSQIARIKTMDAGWAQFEKHVRNNFEKQLSNAKSKVEKNVEKNTKRKSPWDHPTKKEASARKAAKSPSGAGPSSEGQTVRTLGFDPYSSGSSSANKSKRSPPSYIA